MATESFPQQAAFQAWQRYIPALSRNEAGSQVSQYISPEYRIAKHILSVPEAESVFINRTKEIIRVWTIVDDPGEEVFDAIYERERLVIREHGQERFDFHVVARKGRLLRSVLSLSYPSWTRRRE